MVGQEIQTSPSDLGQLLDLVRRYGDLSDPFWLPLEGVGDNKMFGVLEGVPGKRPNQSVTVHHRNVLLFLAVLPQKVHQPLLVTLIDGGGEEAAQIQEEIMHLHPRKARVNNHVTFVCPRPSFHDIPERCTSIQGPVEDPIGCQVEEVRAMSSFEGCIVREEAVFVRLSRDVPLRGGQ